MLVLSATSAPAPVPTMALHEGPSARRGSLLPALQPRHPHGLELGAGDARRHRARLPRGIRHGRLEPVLWAVLCQTIVVILALWPQRHRAVEPWLAALILGIMAVHLHVAFTTSRRASPRHPGRRVDRVHADPRARRGDRDGDLVDRALGRLQPARVSKAGIIGSGAGLHPLDGHLDVIGATAIWYSVVLAGGEAIPFDPVTIVEPFGWPLAIVIFLSVMATNTMVVYGMVTSVVNAVPGQRVKFLPTALILGVISIIGATFFGLLNQFTTFLVLIGALFAPVFAIMIADYYIVKRGAYTADILNAERAPTGTSRA